MELLLGKVDIDINKPNNNGNTALYTACRKGFVKIVKKLLERGADFRNGQYGIFTPIMVAAFNNHKEVVGILLEKITDVNDITKIADKEKAEEFCRERNIEIPPHRSELFGKSALEITESEEIRNMINEKIEAINSEREKTPREGCGFNKVSENACSQEIPKKICKKFGKQRKEKI